MGKKPIAELFFRDTPKKKKKNSQTLKEAGDSYMSTLTPLEMSSKYSTNLGLASHFTLSLKMYILYTQR